MVSWWEAPTATANIEENGIFALAPNPNNVFVDWLLRDSHPAYNVSVSYREGYL